MRSSTMILARWWQSAGRGWQAVCEQSHGGATGRGHGRDAALTEGARSGRATAVGSLGGSSREASRRGGAGASRAHARDEERGAEGGSGVVLRWRGAAGREVETARAPWSSGVRRRKEGREKVGQAREATSSTHLAGANLSFFMRSQSFWTRAVQRTDRN